MGLLASRRDWAVTGFHAADRDSGKCLAPCERLSGKVVRAGLGLIRKYRRLAPDRLAVAGAAWTAERRDHHEVRDNDSRGARDNAGYGEG